MAFIDTFAKYHTLSKYPVDESTSLANVRNKSGHTVTTSDIWSSEIPAFFVVYDDVTRNSLAAKEGDLCKQGSQLYEYKDGAWATRKALVDGEVIGDVIKYHKGCKAVILTDTNNSGTGGNGYSVRIRPNGAAATDPFIDSFISSMDKVVNGIPSVGYDPVVHDTTSSTGYRGEGTGTNDYIANCYGGVITFNTKRDQVDSKGNPTGNNAEITITIDCFEYIGDKLNTTLTDIDEKISKVVGDAFEGAVASVTADSNTKNLGLTVSEGANPVITVTPGAISEAKLVTGSTVKTYVDTTALAEGGSIANAIADYVAENAKVSVNEVEAKTVTVASGSQTGDLVQIVVTNDKTKAEDGEIGIKLTATLDAAVLNEDGSIKEDGVVIATIAKDIAEKVADTAITNAITTDNGAIKDAIADAISDATLADGQKIATTTDTSKLVTVEDVTTYVSENAKVTLHQGTGITVTPNGEASTSFTVAVDGTVATKKSVDDLSGLVTALSETVGSNKTEVDGKISAIEGQLGANGTTGQAIKAAQDAADAAQQTANQAKATADGAVQSVTRANGSSTLLTVTDGTNAAISLSTEVATKTDAANAASSAITTSLSGTTDGTIGKAIADVKATADAAVKTVSKSGSSTLLTVTQTGTAVTVGLSDTVATKSDITTEISKLSATGGAIAVLDGRVDAIETSLAAGGETAEAIAAAKKAGTDAQTAADAKVADVTVNGTSIVTGADGSKTVALTTTKTDAITASADSTSTALATEASVAKALASITSVGVSYEVLADGQTHTSVATPVKGRIYLEKDTTNAEAGVYIEWFYTGSDWEKIGSTKTDHSSYASTITVNGSEKSVANSAVDLGAFASSVTAGNGIASGSVSATGALSLTLTTGSTTAVGIVQLTDAYTSTDATKAATGKSIAAAIATLDATKSVNGITVTQVDGVITSITEKLITASVPPGTTSVEGNVAYVGVGLKEVIAPDKFQTAAQMPATLTSWVADLSNLTNGDYMFKNCTGLTVFVGDLSSLTSAVGMFYGCALDEDSLEILSENLPKVSDGTIDIGASTNATADMIAEIKSKGWTVMSNGAAL